MARVQVEQGMLEGVVCERDDSTFYAFKGIPYAKPPLGELRFKVSRFCHTSLLVFICIVNINPPTPLPTFHYHISKDKTSNVITSFRLGSYFTLTIQFWWFLMPT